VAVAVVLALGLAASGAYAHCQIPCGIYDDDARFAEIAEHITTIEKSMKQVRELGAAKERNDNQIVRWVMNKEAHADQLAEIVTAYFMTQRLKPADPNDKAATAKYVEKLTLLHRMLVAAMKAKQTTDEQHVKELRTLLDAFAHAYGSKWHSH
jgi:nickel superoxide dismutase